MSETEMNDEETDAFIKQAGEDLDEYQMIETQLIAACDLPEAERLMVFNRLMAKVLHRRDILPDHLRKFLDN